MPMIPGNATGGTGLAGAMFTSINATCESFCPPSGQAALALWCDAMALAIVEYIAANATVTITTAVATGVTSGPGTAPVTGIGTIS